MKMEIPRNGDDAEGTLRFNACLPAEHQITSPPKRTGTKVKKVEEENFDLPWDVLDIISEKLDFDDLFHFSGVCKSWSVSHKIYWRNFLASQAPLLIQRFYFTKEAYSFRSLPDHKVYWWSMMDGKYYYEFRYCTSSSGYFIMLGKQDNNSIVLINPFTRITKVINTSTFEVRKVCHALLAFAKCSKEFVLLVLSDCPRLLHVYQSRNCGWVTYPTVENVGVVLDFVVLHNIIYVVTDKANIRVLNLNSADIKFLKLKSTPNVTTKPGIFPLITLVNCNEQLLVVDFNYKKIRNVYKIDFSTMSYVNLKTLGDIALFYTCEKSCYALSNPNRWGYESNSVYVSTLSSVDVSVCSGDNKKCTTLLTRPEKCSFMFDWCFRHLQYEVDYSLVE